MWTNDKIEDLLGKTLVSASQGDDSLLLETQDGQRYSMYHSQDCCESVYIESIVGDLTDLIGNPLLQAEEVSGADEPALHDYEESYTWTFYKLGTIKGGVVIRWYGSSNGYYSE